MESWVLSGCGLRPLPSVVYRSKARLLPNPKLLDMALSVPGSTRTHLGRPIFTQGSTLRDWGLRVSTPATVVSLEEEDRWSRSTDDCTTSTGHGEGVAGDGDFDPGMPPPFGLADLRAAIPKHCWVKDPVRSMSYVVQDVGIVLALAAAAAYINSWIVWPLYWVAQGTMFWALFSLGHDCGHGSFSDNPKLNNVVGHFLHTSILIPYHGWRISHRTHHQNIGHVEKDESWHPLPETAYRGLDLMTRKFWFTPPLPLIAFPFYLWGGTPGNRGSHYDPNSNMFVPSERKDVILSTSWWAAMVALLAGLSWLMGPIKVLNLYGIPYWISMMWLAFVTYLHHHGHDDKLPWYRGKDWSYLRGGLTTIDRDYGLFNSIHHDINTHVIHHLFPQIPHYHLVEATEAARPVLGKYYREPKKSGPFPFHLFGDLVRSLRSDHYVSDTGGVVYYQTDPELTGSSDKSE